VEYKGYKGSSRIVETYIHMNMAINVHECGRGGKCVYKWTYTYALITKKEMPSEKEKRHMS